MMEYTDMFLKRITSQHYFQYLSKNVFNNPYFFYHCQLVFFQDSNPTPPCSTLSYPLQEVTPPCP